MLALGAAKPRVPLPAVSSGALNLSGRRDRPRMRACRSPVSLSTNHGDLLVVGAGTLGGAAAQLWASEGHGRVVAETRTEARHGALSAMPGVTPRLRGEAIVSRFPFVLFSLPPSAGDDYVTEARRAASLWDSEGEHDGLLVMTSSGGVYAEESGGVVDELGETAGGPRQQAILGAEQVILDAGGVVVRLAGLYTATRGAHAYWIKAGKISGRPDAFVNLLHYDDATSLSLAALLHGRRTSMRIFLGADDVVTTREGIIDAALAGKRFAGSPRPTFEGIDGPLGRCYDTTKTRHALDWVPSIPSFSVHMLNEMDE